MLSIINPTYNNTSWRSVQVLQLQSILATLYDDAVAGTVTLTVSVDKVVVHMHVPGEVQLCRTSPLLPSSFHATRLRGFLHEISLRDIIITSEEQIIFAPSPS